MPETGAWTASLATTTALVFPSIIDKWGYAVLEALAAGVPVIAFEGINAIPELVTHEVTGLPVPTEDEAIAAAVVRLLDSPDFASHARRCRSGRRPAPLRRQHDNGATRRDVYEAVRCYRRTSAAATRWANDRGAAAIGRPTASGADTFRAR